MLHAGKSPTIIFADADIAAAAASAAGGVMTNSGQVRKIRQSWLITRTNLTSTYFPKKVCVAGSRLYVEKSIEEEFVAALRTAMATYTSGSVVAPGTTLGPLADAVQGKAVSKYLEIGKTEGTVLLGGNRITGAEVSVPSRDPILIDTNRN